MERPTLKLTADIVHSMKLAASYGEAMSKHQLYQHMSNSIVLLKRTAQAKPSLQDCKGLQTLISISKHT
jgi:hypothetical protein